MIAEKIRILLIKTGMNVPKLAKAKGTTSQNIYNKLSRDNFTVKELKEIAELAGAELEISFVLKKGNKAERI